MEMKGESVDREEFSVDQLTVVDAVIKGYKHKPGALIPVLEEIQETLGYIPTSIQEKVALGLRVPLSEVHGVVTFYHFFTMVPRGRHTIRCCLGTACYVRGGRNTLDKVTHGLNTYPGETTADRRFTVETVRCLGACGLAPVIMVDEDTHKQVKPSRVMDIIEDYE